MSGLAASGALRSPNGALAVLLIALVALAPLPLGSNRPVFWALGAFLMGLVGALYLWRLQVVAFPLRHDLGRLRLCLGMAGAYLAYLVVQTLPLGAVFGAFTAHVPQGDFAHDAISLSVGDTRLAALRMAGYGMLFLLMLQVAANRARANRLGWTLFGICVGWALYALLLLIQFDDTILFLEKWDYHGSATGPFVNRNAFATYLAMGLILGAGLVLGDVTRPSRGPRPLFGWPMMRIAMAGIGALLVLATLLRTQSRMGVLAGLLGLGLTVALILLRRRGAGLRGALLIPVGLAVLAAGGILLFGDGLMDRVGTLDDAARTRGALYMQILDMIAQRPWTGWGADSFETVFRAFRTDPVSAAVTWERAHSTYLAHWVETGVIFGSIPMVLVALAFYRALFLTLTRPHDFVLPAIAAGVILTCAVHALVDFSLEMQANVWTFLTLIALGLGGVAEREERS